MTADALTNTEEPDIDREWELFVCRQKKSVIPGFIKSFKVFFNRNVAAVLFYTIASLAVVAATLGVSYSFSRSKATSESKQGIEAAVGKTERAAIAERHSEQAGKHISEELCTVIFKDESFDGMISSIADFYGVQVVNKNEKSKELRMYFQWNQTLPLNEIVEQLNNFEQIDISITDNTITIE